MASNMGLFTSRTCPGPGCTSGGTSSSPVEITPTVSFFAAGTNWTIEQVLEIGDRIYNIERMFNKAAGMKPEDDRLPKRLLEEPVANGPSTGMTSQLPLTLPQYYEARGWVNAFPTDETLKKLGLDECVGR